ncbi:MAG TPA: aminomethyl-transferring glycine dehydrogenase [Gemmatimonadales bacterium]|jgi:glycine dehydrogenase|nr:aminomethyl-transferring glycine dehydrogenase [Gemmatimonadales bacterium]
MTTVTPPARSPRSAAAPAAPSAPVSGRQTHFASRHIGPRARDIEAMLGLVGYASLDALADAVVPDDIRLRRPLALPPGRSEREVLQALRAMAGQNQVFRSYIGMGYHGTFTPPVILRNILENPGWYTAYTPYQAEIAQGRLEALFTFQTVTAELTGLPIATASLLDEATAAAEAMALTQAVSRQPGPHTWLVDSRCHPQTIAVVRTRAEARGIAILEGEPDSFTFEAGVIGCLVQYPATDGEIRNFRDLAERAHAAGALVTAATDLLALALIEPPGAWGADIAVGNSQRFGVPMGYGGPHAAFFVTREDYKRHLPGRIIGMSRDTDGRPALRMALQTREQHIRREKATSNICTAQVLLAVMAAMYAVYHGPDGIRRIAEQVHGRAVLLANALRRLQYRVVHDSFFDTVAVDVEKWAAARILDAARARKINLRQLSPTRLAVALDETVTLGDLADLITVFSQDEMLPFMLDDLGVTQATAIPESLRRRSEYLTHPVFQKYRSETEMLRYLKRLESRDLSLTAAMIPLGSCTMKLNATTEMIPIGFREFNRLHPFAPQAQAQGYQVLFSQLEDQLAEITGFARVSLQPNAGAQGEFAGLMVIRAFHAARGDTKRLTCLIPTSAHGTNPASAVMAGMKVVNVRSDEQGNIDLDDLKAKAAEHRDSLAALMVTYPSTHGVFENSIREICRVVHEHGGQVYMDGANMNAQVGLCRPADIGADVCHLNLHKTFCIPHGGGGPGMGPICVAAHLAPFLPGHPVVDLHHGAACGTIAAAPWGSAMILPISWAYIALMGSEGLREATIMAILNANYIARRLEGHFDLLYSGAHGLIAHECILDMRPFKQSAGIEVEDIAKRIIDFGFHPPTVSFPVAGTLMVEPTESESKEELDRFCDAMIAIREEIREIENGTADREQNLLKGAPHTLAQCTANEWARPYERERAAFPAPEARSHKVWPWVSRVDGAWGDRNLVCTWTESYSSA